MGTKPENSSSASLRAVASLEYKDVQVWTGASMQISPDFFTQEEKKGKKCGGKRGAVWAEY